MEAAMSARDRVRRLIERGYTEEYWIAKIMCDNDHDSSRKDEYERLARELLKERD